MLGVLERASPPSGPDPTRPQRPRSPRGGRLMSSTSLYRLPIEGTQWTFGS